MLGCRWADKEVFRDFWFGILFFFVNLFLSDGVLVRYFRNKGQEVLFGCNFLWWKDGLCHNRRQDHCQKTTRDQHFQFILQIENIKMNYFKVQKFHLSQQKNTTESSSINSPQLYKEIESTVRLNYPISTLIQIFATYFEEDGFAINVFVRTLKILSLSLKDDELRENLEKIVKQNQHRNEKIYNLFVYWCSFMKNIESLLSKLDKGCCEILVSKMLAMHLFSDQCFDLKVNKQIQKILELQNISPPNVMKTLKNQYISLGLPLSTFFSKLGKISFKFENTKNFLKSILSYTIKNSPKQLASLLKAYPTSVEDREKTDHVFLNFPSLNAIFVSNIQQIFHEKMLMKFLEDIEGKKSENIIRMAIREWLNKDKNYWKLMEQNFTDYEKRQKLIKLGLQIQNQKVFHEYVAKKYLYEHFKGFTFQVNEQNSLSEKLNIPPLNEMVKSLNQNVSKGCFNVIMLNKIQAPNNWPKVNPLTKKHNIFQNGKGKEFISEFDKLFQKIQEKYTKNSKSVELAYHVLLLHDRQTQTNLFMTYSQLLNYLDNGKIQELYESQYSLSVQKEVKNEVKTKDSNIVIEALIVKLLKKAKEQVDCTDIAKKMEVEETVCEAGLKRLINKGFVEKKNEKYVYVP